MNTVYMAGLTDRSKRRLRNAARTCGAKFASRGARGVLRGDTRCVWLRSGLVASVHHRDNDTFTQAKKAWL